MPILVELTATQSRVLRDLVAAGGNRVMPASMKRSDLLALWNASLVSTRVIGIETVDLCITGKGRIALDGVLAEAVENDLDR